MVHLRELHISGDGYNLIRYYLNAVSFSNEIIRMNMCIMIDMIKVKENRQKLSDKSSWKRDEPIFHTNISIESVRMEAVIL